MKKSNIKIVKKDNRLEKFLALPDWKKMSLINKPPYSRFPLMSQEQKIIRNNFIYSICFHFGNYYDKVENLKNMNFLDATFIDLDTSWPTFLNFHLTPRLLDILDPKFFIDFGCCYFCHMWKSYNKTSYKVVIKNIFKSKIIPMRGICECQFNDLSHTSPYWVCQFWSPLIFIRQTIEYKLQKFILENEKEYSLANYNLDKRKIDFWNFFKGKK